MRPLGNKVLVRPGEDPQHTASGIVLPASAVGPVGRGVAIAVGKGAVTMTGDLIPMEVQEGDVVLYPRKQGVEVEVEGEKLLIFYETDLFGILPPKTRGQG